MTGELSKNFHGVGIGPLSKILAVKNFQGLYIVSKNFLRKFRDFIYSLGFL